MKLERTGHSGISTTEDELKKGLIPNFLLQVLVSALLSLSTRDKNRIYSLL